MLGVRPTIRQTSRDAASDTRPASCAAPSMYQDFFGLRELPFELTSNPRCLSLPRSTGRR